jgi:hypothetical protein
MKAAKPMRTFLATFAFLLGLCSSITSAQNNRAMDVKAIAADVTKRIEACPRRETVTAFERKHHKLAWVKGAWGPPINVFVDVKPNDSLLYPYILIVEFDLLMTEGKEKNTEEEAENDSNLSPLPLFHAARYRNTFLVSEDGLHLRATEVLDTDLNGVAKGWEDRPRWADACWDRLR